MKTKYVSNGGLAFSEKRDIKKLEKLAAEGWLFKAFAFGGFFYKLVKGPQQELTYTMDFQSKPDAEYFDIFASTGWHHITSCGNQVHVFSAPKGTPPIYSGNEINEGKYEEITSGSGKLAIFSLLALVTLSVLTKISKAHFEFMFFPLMIAAVVSYIAFVFSFMPYVAYKYKAIRNNTFSETKASELLNSSNEVDEGNHTKITAVLSKGMWYSFDALLVFLVLWKISAYYFEYLNYPLFVLTLISLMALVCFFVTKAVYQLNKRRNKVQ